MATAPIENAGSRLSWEFSSGITAELCQFGVHTGRRDDSNYSDIADEMVAFYTALGTANYLAEQRLRAVVISDWATGPGFTGWHQVYREERNDLLGVETWLPPQIALAVGYRNTEELGIALGRRRNRAFLGVLSSGTMDITGSMDDATRDGIAGAFKDFHDAIVPIPATGAFDPVFNGICVASPTEGVLMTAQELVVGRAYDTMRSRRQTMPEYPEVFAL